MRHNGFERPDELQIWPAEANVDLSVDDLASLLADGCSDFRMAAVRSASDTEAHLSHCERTYWPTLVTPMPDVKSSSLRPSPCDVPFGWTPLGCSTSSEKLSSSGAIVTQQPSPLSRTVKQISNQLAASEKLQCTCCNWCTG